MFKQLIRSTFFIMAAYLLYVAASLFHLELLAGIAAPLFGLLAVGVIFHSIFTSVNKMFRLHFILIGSAVLCWALADLLWFAYTSLLGSDPADSDLITVLYFGTNICLVVTILHYVYLRMRRWDAVQLVLDGAVFATGILWLIWSLLFDQSFDKINLLVGHSLITASTLLIDLFLLIAIWIWYMSIRGGYLPATLRLVVGSIFAFAIIDILYYHLYANGLYVPDTLLDICYLGTLLGMTLAIKIWYIQYPNTYTNHNINTNVGHIHKGFALVICPLLIAMFGTISIADILIYAVLIMVHEYASSYIQTSLRNKSLLSVERATTKLLEQQVYERTLELEAANTTLRQRNEDLHYINLHDPLTGLYNRAYFMDALETAIQTAGPDGQVALLLWNIDNLKSINDTYGHFTGDKILIQHAGRIRALLEGRGKLARIGGDEFAFILTGDNADDEAPHVARQVVQSCVEPIEVGGYYFRVTIGVGIALYPLCSSDRTTLLKHTDIALHYAKETKPESRISLYREINTYMDRKYMIGNSLRTADYDRDLHLHFQPQFRTQDRMLVGMEALLRWNCPGLGPVSPAEFIPIAEEENLIIPIGNWVIENAVRQIAAWNKAHHTDLRMGINISPKQFDQTATLTVLDSALRRYQALPKWIDIEITEGVALDNEDSAGSIKQYFKNRGISVSIDDFGTGYSSLGYLTILSFDRLKIAKPLIDKITTDESRRKIITSIILLAKSLDLLTVAEGVEQKSQFDMLQQLQCDQIQGFYLGHPVPKEEFESQFLLPYVNAVQPSPPA